MIVGKTENTPQGLPYGVAVAGLSWSVFVSQFDFSQSQTVETAPGCRTVLEIDDDIQNNVRKIVTENPKMIEFTGKSGTSSGDAFLIATAMKYGLIIITEENKDKQMKIPQISKKYGITSVNITSLCDMEQWKF